MILVDGSGDFGNTLKFLKRMKKREYMTRLNEFGKKGVAALSSATPKESGKTADSWSYEVIQNASGSAIYWSNSNTNKGVNVAVILQYGHGTRNGGYVAGRDYINPAIRPVFDDILTQMWKEVVK